MEPATVVVIVLVAAAALGILWLPMRKRWNDDGADDAKRQAVEQQVQPTGAPRAVSGLHTPAGSHPAARPHAPADPHAPDASGPERGSDDAEVRR